MSWSQKEIAGRVRYGSEADGNSIEECLVDQFLDAEKQEGPKFCLYYFAKDFTYLAGDNRVRKRDLPKRTVLFLSGGPGEINRPGSSNFGDLDGYRIVYLHLRGAGFSQIPASNYFDRFLRTRYAVIDIERIREDLHVEKWCAIVGHSYGTVVAQQYAHRYGNQRVEKLVLSAPLSRHKPTTETIQFKSLRKIYDSEYFDFFAKIATRDQTNLLKERLTSEAEDVSKRAETEFGSVHFLTELYSSPEFDRSLLKKKELDYSAGFFKALRRLRLTGWLPHDDDLAKGAPENVDTVQQLAGLLIAKEILGRMSSNYDMTEINSRLESYLRRPNSDELNRERGKEIGEAEAYFSSLAANTPRVFYVVSIYDGINERFQREFEAGAEMKTAIASVGGKENINKSLANIAIENDDIRRWDPAKFAHDVPTLILKGDADPVTEGGQAEYVFDNGLSGQRVLIEFPGVGHSMALPRMTNDLNRNTRDYLLQEFLSGNFNNLKDSVLPRVRSAFEDLLKQPSHARFSGLKVRAQYASETSDTVEW